MSDTEMRANFTSFDQSTMQDWSLIVSQLPVTQALAADNIVEQLRLLARDEEYVLCALVHDIGDTLAPYNHPAVAASIVKPFVSAASHWMVEHHGIFQGYYFWHHIGMDRNARDQFADSPYYDYTEEFCATYDQTAFDPDYVGAPLSHYEPLIAEFFHPAGASAPLPTATTESASTER